MDLEPLMNFFSQGGFSFLPAPFYSAQFIARILFGILNKIGFKFEFFTQILEKLHIKLHENVVNELLEVAKKGVDGLSKWINDRLQNPEVKEIAGKVIASLSNEIGSAFDQAVTDPQERQSVAKKVDDSLKEVGGITQNYPVDLSKVLLDKTARAQLVNMLQNELGIQPVQEMIAEQNSKILASQQINEGGIPAAQKMVARDNSVIQKSKQKVGVSKARPKAQRKTE